MNLLQDADTGAAHPCTRVATPISALLPMFRNTQRGTLISMSQTSWIDVDMNELPTGTVTLLLADVEG